MIINVSTLAAAINECRHILPEEIARDNKLKHWKVVFEIYDGKQKNFSWFCFAANYEQAKQAAHDFLEEELAKGYYHSGMILLIKEI